jgi:hypothetical protein
LKDLLSFGGGSGFGLFGGSGLVTMRTLGGREGFIAKLDGGTTLLGFGGMGGFGRLNDSALVTMNDGGSSC